MMIGVLASSEMAGFPADIPAHTSSAGITVLILMPIL
jgi:hypothetical protein